MNKVFIFDFDGTFYSGEHKFDNVEKVVRENRRRFLKNVDDETYGMICKENPRWLQTITGNDIIRLIYKFRKKYPNLDINIEEFMAWQETMPYDIIIDYNQIVDIDFIKKLSKEYSVYVVSNSSLPHIHHYMKKLGINPSWFKKVYSNEFLDSDPSKQHYYKEIMATEKATPHNIYIFGDSVDSDLAPGLKLGMNGFYIDNACNIKPLVSKVLDNHI